MKHSPNSQNAKNVASINDQTLFKLNTDAILIIDHVGIIQNGNAASEKISGYSLNELKNQSFLTFIENKEQAKACFANMMKGIMSETRIQLLHKSGKQINCLVKCIPINESDFKNGLYLILKDLSMYDSLISKYRQSELNFQIIAENVQDVIILMNQQRQYLYVSPSIQQMFGLDSQTVEKLLQKDPFYYNHPEYTELLEQSYIEARKTGNPFRIIIKILHKEKGWVWTEVKGTPVFDDENNFRQMVLVVSDISAQKEKQDQLEYYAYHDPLTGLPNRRYFEKCLTECIEKLNLKGQTFSLILFDIDDFKKINDSWGHEIGDQVIQEVANRTQHVVVEQGIAARLGGDEFIVLLYNCHAEEEVKEVIHKLQNELLKEIVTEKKTIEITNSIGATICRKKHMSETYYFKSADVALYEVKQKGKNQYHINYS
ncbi:diguanylate cyclase domain-containing protein [Ureibacillus sp. GCM10028918]|uniref:diguanylate cyclase domain-containing protein n=1 Tax=Ureibacillus sp. GCM10028918 TaxID=3273429 RepID=UPI0036098474